MNNKPNQHYVWQKYLEAWIKDGRIACLRNSMQYISSTPRNLASQRYFYKINCLTQNDFLIIRRAFIGKIVSVDLINLVDGWIKPIEQHFQLYNYLDSRGELTDEIKSSTNLALKNLLEETHSVIEKSRLPGLNKLKSGCISFLFEGKDENEEDVGFIIFLCFQYFGTKAIKENVKDSLGDYAFCLDSFDDSFNLLALIFSTTMGSSIHNR